MTDARATARLGLLLLLALLAGTGCHATRVATVSDAQVAAAMELRFDGALTSGARIPPLNRLISAALTDPELAEALEQLLASVAESPDIAASLENIQNGVADTPQMEALVARIVQEHPGAGPAEVGQLVAERSDRALASPTVDRALSAAFARWLARPPFEQLADATSRNPFIARELSRAFREWNEAQLSARLTEANRGKVPNETRSGQVLIQHAFTDERIQTLFQSVLGLPEARDAVRGALLHTLRSPAFRHQFQRFLASVLAAPELRAAVVSAVGVVLEDSVDAARVDAALRQFFDAPLLERESTVFMRDVVRDPELQAIGRRALDGLARSPGFIAAFHEFALDW